MPDFSTITELPESLIHKLQLERSYSRYRFAADFCSGFDVLEVACGGGQGLGLLAERARKVVGGDCEPKNLQYAIETYRTRKNIEIIKLDAHDLVFPNESFDVVILYEAIYYLKSPERFLQECQRVLRPGGILIICTANKNWPDFNPSPFSYQYFSVPELKVLCSQNGFGAEFFGAFPDDPKGAGSKILSRIKRLAVQCHLMPKTMKGKVLLKRIFYGGLIPMPRELRSGMLNFEAPAPLSPEKNDTRHTAIYVVARKK